MLPLLGIAIPFGLALATYRLFAFLDKKASSAARHALSNWIKSEPYQQWDLRQAIVAIFDRLYTTPLFTIAALSRSTLYSIAAFVVWTLIKSPEIARTVTTSEESRIFLLAFFLSQLVSDFFSLFLVRFTLNRSHGLFGSLLLSAVVGVGLVFAIYIFILFLFIGGFNFIVYFLTHGSFPAPDQVHTPFEGFMYGMFMSIGVITRSPFTVSAFLVHLWLVIFAIGALGTRVIQTFVSAVGWLQWFIVRGKHHPLEAIGFIAAAVVFIGTIATQIVSRFV
jgi:hypothetical protein